MSKKILLLLIAGLPLLTTVSVTAAVSTVTIDNQTLYSIDALKEKANAAAQNKEYKKAVFLFRQLVKKLPENEENQLKLAFVLFMAKDYYEAKKSFTLLVKHSANKQYITFSNKKLQEIQVILKKLASQPRKLIKKTGEHPEIEVNDNPQASYICNKTDPTIFPEGNFYRWEKKDLPVKVYIPKVPEDFDIKDSEKYAGIVEKAMNKWESSGVIRFKFISEPKDANININWINNFTDTSIWGKASLPQYDEKNKKRISTINLALRAQPGTAVFSSEAVLFSEIELTQIITHETGHALGLGHSFSDIRNIDLMSQNYQSILPGYESSLTERDIKTLKQLYSFPANAICKCKATDDGKE